MIDPVDRRAGEDCSNVSKVANYDVPLRSIAANRIVVSQQGEGVGRTVAICRFRIAEIGKIQLDSIHLTSEVTQLLGVYHPAPQGSGLCRDVRNAPDWTTHGPAITKTQPSQTILRTIRWIGSPVAGHSRVIDAQKWIFEHVLIASDTSPVSGIADLPPCCVATEIGDMASAGHEGFYVIAHLFGPVFVVARQHQDAIVFQRTRIAMEIPTGAGVGMVFRSFRIQPAPQRYALILPASAVGKPISHAINGSLGCDTSSSKLLRRIVEASAVAPATSICVICGKWPMDDDLVYLSW